MVSQRIANPRLRKESCEFESHTRRLQTKNSPLGLFLVLVLAIRYSLFANLVLSSKTTSRTAAKAATASAASKTSSPFCSFSHWFGFIDGNGSFSDLLAVH